MPQPINLIASWANDLNSNLQWKKALNSAFNKIGFDKKFVDQCRKEKDSSERIIGVKDHVWGMIELYPSAKWLIEGPLIQRLRTIKQLGFSYLTYPNAQASAQVRIWCGKQSSTPKENSNYFRRSLRDPNLLNSRDLYFVFALGMDKGRDHLLAACADCSLTVENQKILFGASLQDRSGRTDGPTPISSELRDFLRNVGRQIIRPHIEKNLSVDALDKECDRKSLGYDNLEGLTATPSNVPTSTYTAIWRPGVYTPVGGSPSDVLAWHPLLIRQGMLRDVVIG